MKLKLKFITFPVKTQTGSCKGKEVTMLTVNEIDSITHRENLAGEVRRLLFEELRKATAQNDWQRIATIIYYLKGSSK